MHIHSRTNTTLRSMTSNVDAGRTPAARGEAAFPMKPAMKKPTGYGVKDGFDAFPKKGSVDKAGGKDFAKMPDAEALDGKFDEKLDGKFDGKFDEKPGFDELDEKFPGKEGVGVKKPSFGEFEAKPCEKDFAGKKPVKVGPKLPAFDRPLDAGAPQSNFNVAELTRRLALPIAA